MNKMLLLKVSKRVRIHRHHSSIAVNKPKCDHLSSLEIRNIFLDHFITKHHHKFIRSSPVTPFCDPTVPFVNAGMNQFKNVFLNRATAPHKTVANSQKCIRVGGKHNDLNVIGTDGYHHTFFEMLGNWSFGDYFKERACKLAWDLLTNSYKIDPSRLYVSYFGGDEQLGLKPDLECKEIWQSIGVPVNRILPFGATENFWEMGLTGPCGTCSEIHIDHLPNSNPAHRASFVNAGSPDLTELWNIVFIEYNRNLDGSIEPLKEKFIDTGMGFERLVAVMQGTTSNYDTDLFTPIFDAILKESKKPAYSGVYDQNDARYELDYAYRLVADHVRMCSVCIADKMYPQNNNRLRKIIRKSLKVCEETFGKDRIIQNAIVPAIIETLGSVYPELEKSSKNICEVFSHEDHLYKSSIENNRKLFKSLNISPTSDWKEEDVIDFPNFSRAYEDIDMLLKANKSMDSLSSEYLYEKMYVTFGLSEEIIQRLASERNLKIDWDAFELYKMMKKSEAKSKYDIDEMAFIEKLTLENIPKTEYHQMYDYKFDDKSKLFVVTPLKANVQFIVPDGNLYHIVLNKTNFYHSAGGQDSDAGQIISSNGEKIFNVENVEIHKEYVIHSGHFTDKSQPFKQNDEVNLLVDAVRRTNLSQNHTAMHLLQAAMKLTTKQIVFQQSSHVSADNLKCELGSIGKRIDLDQLERLEKCICRTIECKLPIETQHLNAHELYALDNLTTVPGAIYPDDGIRILKVKDERKGFESIEPCCGTHARNTGELEDFCFTSFKNNPSGWYDIIAVTGQRVHSIKQREQDFLKNYISLKQYTEHHGNTLDDCETMELLASDLKRQLAKDEFRHITKIEFSSRIEDVTKQIRKEKRDILKRLVTTELETILEKREQSNESFIIHILKTEQPLDDMLMDAAVNMCNDLPVILLNVCDDIIIQGCANVPLKYTHDGKFNANHWIRAVADSIKLKCSPAKEKTFSSHSKMKVTNRTVEPERLEIALAKARTLGRKMFDTIVSDDEYNRKIQADELVTRVENIGVQLNRIDNLGDLLKINQEATEARNDVKEKLYANAIKVKCSSMLEEVNNQIVDMRCKTESELYLSHFENAIAESSSKQQPFIFHVIHAEHPLHHRTIRTMTDMSLEHVIVLIIISKNDVVGRISIPLNEQNEQLSAKRLTDEFSNEFDGKCIHDGERYGSLVTDFELKKDLVDEGKLKNVFGKVEKLIKEIYRK